MSNSKEKKSKNLSRREMPKPEVGDHVRTATRATLQALPLLGGTAAEVYNLVFAPPLQKRQLEWMKNIADDLTALEEKFAGVTEGLSENVPFITVALHASQVALRNHQKEKLEALRNAVLNSALPSAPSEDMQLMILSLIDSFTPTHIRVLNFYYNYSGKDTIVAFEKELPALIPKILSKLNNELQKDYPTYVGILDQMLPKFYDQSIEYWRQNSQRYPWEHMLKDSSVVTLENQNFSTKIKEDLNSNQLITASIAPMSRFNIISKPPPSFETLRAEGLITKIEQTLYQFDKRLGDKFPGIVEGYIISDFGKQFVDFIKSPITNEISA